MSPLNQIRVRTILFLLGLLLLPAVPASIHAQWMRAASPIETQTVSAQGEVVPFSINLPTGMDYWVRSSGVVQASTDGGQADSRYYISGLPVPSGQVPFGVPVGLRVIQSPGTDNFMQTVAPSTYSSSHQYVGAVRSNGLPLRFRLFDRGEPGAPGTNYYADNAGNMTIEVSQGTPELILQKAALDFGIISTRYPKTLIDSIQSYGKFPLNVTRVWIEPLTAINVFSVVSERGQSFQLPETATNEFKVTAQTSVRGTHMARLHIVTTNAWGTNDHVVLLQAIAHRPEILYSPIEDTLDFGVISAGASASKIKMLTNIGDSATSITSVRITPQNPIFTETHRPELPVREGKRIDFVFTPPSPGVYIARVDVEFEWGQPKRFYLKGIAGTGIPKLDVTEVDFGTVIIGGSKSASIRLRNIGDAEFLVTKVEIDNDQFTIDGPTGTRRVGAFPGTTDYPLSFRPTRHVEPYHEGTLTLTFNNHPPLTVRLIGRDRFPVEALLQIDTAYYARPGEEVVVKQKLQSDLTQTFNPITKFSQFIQFDKEILELVTVRKGPVVSTPDWELVTVQTGGAIDIILQNTAGRMAGPGVLLEYVFRVLQSAKPGSSSPVAQRTPNFYNPAEPQTSVSDGVVHVVDLCSPPQLVLTGKPALTLGQNFPNPFNPTTSIPFSLDSETHARITLYDEIGRAVAVLLDGTLPGGFHSVALDASSLNSGLYHYELVTPHQRVVRTMMLLK